MLVGQPTYSTLWQLRFFEIVLAAPHGILKPVFYFQNQSLTNKKEIQGTETGISDLRPVTLSTSRLPISILQRESKNYISVLEFLCSDLKDRYGGVFDWGRSGLPHVTNRLKPIIASPTRLMIGSGAEIGD